MPDRRIYRAGVFIELDKNHLKGLLLKSGGTTSHTVILARSFNIPTLVGVDFDIRIFQPAADKAVLLAWHLFRRINRFESDILRNTLKRRI